MKKSCFLLVAGFLSLLGFSQNSLDTQMIKQVVNAFQHDFNEGSFKNATTYTTADWVHINPLGGIDKGRDNVLKVVRSVHQMFLKGVNMRIETMDIRFITSNVAIADVIHQIDNYTTPDGVQHTNERHIKTYVIVREKDKWLLTQDNNTIIQPSQ